MIQTYRPKGLIKLCRVMGIPCDDPEEDELITQESRRDYERGIKKLQRYLTGRHGSKLPRTVYNCFVCFKALYIIIPICMKYIIKMSFCISLRCHSNRKDSKQMI